jgi:hypothetical protein
MAQVAPAIKLLDSHHGIQQVAESVGADTNTSAQRMVHGREQKDDQSGKDPKQTYDRQVKERS